MVNEVQGAAGSTERMIMVFHNSNNSKQQQQRNNNPQNKQAIITTKYKCIKLAREKSFEQTVQERFLDQAFYKKL